MGLKTGLVIGFGAGYLLGSRAGRQRYEQIMAFWDKASASPTVQKATEGAKSLAGDAGRKGLEAVQGGVTKVTGAVRTRLGDDNGSSTSYATGS